MSGGQGGDVLRRRPHKGFGAKRVASRMKGTLDSYDRTLLLDQVNRQCEAFQVPTSCDSGDVIERPKRATVELAVALRRQYPVFENAALLSSREARNGPIGAAVFDYVAVRLSEEGEAVGRVSAFVRAEFGEAISMNYILLHRYRRIHEHLYVDDLGEHAVDLYPLSALHHSFIWAKMGDQGVEVLRV